jgi:hypothetical protein
MFLDRCHVASFANSQFNYGINPPIHRNEAENRAPNDGDVACRYFVILTFFSVIMAITLCEIAEERINA